MLQSQGMVKFFCILQLKLTKLNSDVYCERLSISLTGALNCKIKKNVLVQYFIIQITTRKTPKNSSIVRV